MLNSAEVSDKLQFSGKVFSRFVPLNFAVELTLAALSTTAFCATLDQGERLYNEALNEMHNRRQLGLSLLTINKALLLITPF